MSDTNQSLQQASVRAVTGTTYDYQGDWSALFDLDSIPTGDWNGRMLAWINAQLVVQYTDLPSAMAAFAEANGVANWNSLGTITVGTDFVILLETSGNILLEDSAGFIALQ